VERALTPHQIKTVLRKSAFAALPIQFNHKIKKKNKSNNIKVESTTFGQIDFWKKRGTTDWKTLLHCNQCKSICPICFS
jgi:hypothetical protein